MKETWLPVKGFEGYYEVSDAGRVLSVERIATNGSLRRSKILRPYSLPTGHLTVNLYRGSKRTHRQVHRLVCESFHGAAPEGKPYVLHWDDDPGNNSASNLRWGGQLENMADAKRNGRIKKRYLVKTHCKWGHEFTPENSFIRPNREQRECRTCMRDRSNKRYWRLKDANSTAE